MVQLDGDANQSRSNSSTLDPERLAGQLADWSTHPGPLYAKLAESLADLINTGVLRNGERLPPERKLAATLNVSRGTVVAAYDRLREKDLVERVQGRGTTITVDHGSLTSRAERPTGEPLFQSGAAVDLLMALPDLLPRVASIAQATDVWSNASAMHNSEPAGIHELREAVADQMTADGLPSTPDQIVVTAGAQQGIAMVTSLLAGVGDVVLCEEYTWPGLTDSVRRVGANIVGIPMDDNGIIVDELESAIRRFRPSFIGLNPHNHNPTSTCLPPSRRDAVMRLAAEYRVPVVEDRVCARLNFVGTAPPPMAALDPAGPHMVIDSVNKVAWPGFRIGWIRANVHAIHDLRTTRTLFDLYSPPTTQLQVVEVLRHLDVVTADRVDQLQERHDVTLAAIAEHAPTWKVHRANGGMVLWVELPEIASPGSKSGDPNETSPYSQNRASRFTQFARRLGVSVGSSREFSVGPGADTHIRIPCTATVDQLRDGVARLGEAWNLFVEANESAIGISGSGLDLERAPGGSLTP